MSVLRTASAIVATSTIPATTTAPRWLLHARSVVAGNACPLWLHGCRGHAGVSGIKPTVRRCFCAGGVGGSFGVFRGSDHRAFHRGLRFFLNFFDIDRMARGIQNRRLVVLGAGFGFRIVRGGFRSKKSEGIVRGDVWSVLSG